MHRHLSATAVALGLVFVPAFVAAADAVRPVKLTDAQLDEISAGKGPPAFVLAAGRGPPSMRNAQGQPVQGTQPTTQVTFLIDDVQLTFNIGPNSPVNFAAVLQFSLLSQASQGGSATALQTGG